MKKEKILNIIPIILILLISFISITFSNSIIGFLTLLFGLFNGYYAVIGKWQNYIYGILFVLLNAYISFKTNLYGIAILSILLYFPLQVNGLISWYKNKDKDKKINLRQFNLKTSILIIIVCFILNIILGFFLSKIKTQKLAFLDATSNCINICGVILMILRYKECWIVLLGNNIIDLIIWIINFINNEYNSSIMLIVSIFMLLFNILGIIKWYKKKKIILNQ